MTPEQPSNVAPDAVVVPEPKKSHLPPVENATQAARLAKFLFGPLARVRQQMEVFQVYVQVGESDRVPLGHGKDNQSALEDAFSNVSEAHRSGKTLSPLIMPFTPAVNVVEEKRRNLVVKLPDVQEVEVFSELHPHEVLEVSDLIQMRDFVAVEPFIKTAKERNEARKKEVARLTAEAEALRVKIELDIAEKTAQDAADEAAGWVKAVSSKGEGSSSVDKFKYSAAEEVLSVKFKKAGTYHYIGVPEEVALGMREAESKGTYLAKNVKGLFQFRKEQM